MKWKAFFTTFKVLSVVKNCLTCLWTCEYFYCHCVCNCMKNIDLLSWVYKKINSFFCFQSTIFHWKINKSRGTFFYRGKGHNSRKRTYTEGEGSTCKANRNKQLGVEGLKLWISRERTFWMLPNFTKIKCILFAFDFRLVL